MQYASKSTSLIWAIFSCLISGTSYTDMPNVVCHVSVWTSACVSVCVGKTSLTTQFVENQFNDSYDPTIENSKYNSVSQGDVRLYCITQENQLGQTCMKRNGFQLSVKMLYDSCIRTQPAWCHVHIESFVAVYKFACIPIAAVHNNMASVYEMSYLEIWAFISLCRSL